MNQIDADRRRLAKMGIAVGLLLIVPVGCQELSDDKLATLLKFTSDSDSPINPGQTGKLSEAEFRKLASLCEYVNEAWELTPDLGAYLAVLRADLDLKTGEEPSYLTEYKNAIVIIDALVDKKSEGIKGWAQLLFSDFDETGFENTQLGRARRFVFSEIINHFVPISGGFKTFGLLNYRGNFGGPYRSPESYRKMDIV